MKSITLRAHFDGQRICPDEPLNIAPNTRLLVTVVPVDQTDQERQEWLRLSLTGLSSAYAENEPDYPVSSVERFNPEYEGR